MADLQIIYSKSSDKFLGKNKHIITEEKSDGLIKKAVKNILYNKNENVDVVKMVNYNPNHYRIRTGKIRIVFTLINDIITVVDVRDIDFRGNIYKKNKQGYLY